MTDPGRKAWSPGAGEYDSADLEMARSAAAALEHEARANTMQPRNDLQARVLAALEAEPTPAPLTALSSAARDRRAAGMLAALRDLWGVAWSGGRPWMVRVPAALAVLVLLGGVGSAGGLAAVGAWNTLQREGRSAEPSPTDDRVPIVVPPSPSSMPVEPVAAPSPTPTTKPTVRPTPSSTARPTLRPSATHSPTPRPAPTPTHHPEATHHPDATHAPGHG